jgi:sugar phosphate isomerase/epimerase
VRIGSDGVLDLGYCTNIHPANGWGEVLGSLRAHAPALKARLRPAGPFGIGLRLSGAESRELLAGDRLERFREFLAAEDLYVFTINGFPHGSFHGGPVKADVHAPDWRTDERVAYTLRLVEILAALVPAGGEGSISTSPLSYAGWVRSDDVGAWERFADNLAGVAEALVRLRRERGILLHLDIEPEADGLLADCADLERFYRRWLLGRGAQALAAALGCPRGEACEHLLEHVRACFDACHAAVAYEEPGEALDRLQAAGIRVGKVQLSSALRVALEEAPADRAATERALRAFADSTYLHQVAQRNRDGSLVHYPDLPEALARIQDPRAEEWRIHFHVPIFVDHYAGFRSTQDELRRTLELVRERRVARHLEIETYTWDVLPADLKAELVDSIGREYAWVLDVLG